MFKSILLLNADKLTVDAQSALRRCIEVFSNSTRFFVILTSKSQLLKPLISRFSSIYVEFPLIDNKYTNLNIYKNTYHLEDNINYQKYLKNKNSYLKKIISSYEKNEINLFELTDKLYNNS